MFEAPINPNLKASAFLGGSGLCQTCLIKRIVNAMTEDEVWENVFQKQKESHGVGIQVLLF